MSTTSDALRERVRNAIREQKPRTVTVLSSLLAAQDAIGFLPMEAIEEVADFTHTTINDVYGVASFYPNFRLDPPAEHRVDICWGTSCHVTGAAKLFDAALKELDLPHEGDTPDKKVCLGLETCYNACARGPIVSVDHHLVGDMTPERLRELIARLKQGGPSRNGHGK